MKFKIVSPHVRVFCMSSQFVVTILSLAVFPTGVKILRSLQETSTLFVDTYFTLIQEQTYIWANQINGSFVPQSRHSLNSAC